ncbi:carbohydrate sulfotransferase 1 [Scyliorhinus canicula]|uniref:carbohydrate sulfotransferase 1 n=1 Tax=Scyliorhinus canicula TaxID=7830 RepID=UPI0018F484BD|nr:carbohydrate sulfotransferase 1 [Scyliorhinus canicula]
MQCSWKVVLLLVLASLAIQYTAIRTLSSKPATMCRVAKHTGCAPTVAASCQPSSHILILATTRSGSSFIGQLLNQHPDIFYLFEPLYHVQTTLINSSLRSRPPSAPSSPAARRLLLGAYRDLLRSLFHCHLSELETFIKPTPQQHRTQRLFRRGASKALCSPPVCPPLPPGVGGIAGGTTGGEWCVRRCGALNLTLASRVCSRRLHIAIKTVRIPELADLRPLLEDPRLNLKVVQLVRDPRGILSSRMDTFPDSFRSWNMWRNSGRRPRNLDPSHLTATCQDFLNSVSTGLARPSWLKGRYMLLRYEDLAREPEHKAREMYRFLGLDMDPSVLRWILNNTRSSGTSAKHKFGTVRDSAATAQSWRLKLSFHMVQLVQNLCNITLSQLGYRMVNSPQELTNLSLNLAQHTNLLPFL